MSDVAAVADTGRNAGFAVRLAMDGIASPPGRPVRLRASDPRSNCATNLPEVSRPVRADFLAAVCHLGRVGGWREWAG